MAVEDGGLGSVLVHDVQGLDALGREGGREEGRKEGREGLGHNLFHNLHSGSRSCYTGA